jgi:pimeloyl-ACP methyl ester carboxylesterase
MLGMLSPVIVTGHSLGGALAQLTAAHFPDRVARVVTFNAPGIAAEEVKRFAAAKDQPQVTHHRELADIVSEAGEAHLPGSVYEHEVAPGMGKVEAHQAWLLLTPQFTEQMNQLGLDDATIDRLYRAHGVSEKVIDERRERRRGEHALLESTLDPSAGGLVERARQKLSDSWVRMKILELVRTLERKD